MLCTSGFVDAVIFSHNVPLAHHVYFEAAIEYDKRNSQPNLVNDKDQQVLIVTSTPGAKSAIYGSLCLIFSQSI